MAIDSIMLSTIERKWVHTILLFFMSADKTKAYGLVNIVGDEMIDEHFDTDLQILNSCVSIIALLKIIF